MSSPPAIDHPPVLDALIIGLGFSGTYLLHKLLKLNYNVLALDPNDQLGGVWNHNAYPGARVDISVPSYQLDIPELHNHDPWEWSEKFPSGEELKRFFRWAQDRLHLRRACEFGAWVESAVWREDAAIWVVTGKDGKQWKARWLLPCLGYAAASYLPDLHGLESFQGTVVHSGSWPREGIELEGRRVGIIGTGASAVQIIQTIASRVNKLTVFQRTPATAVPMQQRTLTHGELTSMPLADREAFFADRKSRWDGSPSAIIMRSAKGDTVDQRESEFERLWMQGGFSFWTSNYMDLFVDQESNNLVYDFWKRKVRSRIREKKVQEVLAPDKPPYAFGTKRVPLEQGYYEVFNLPHVSLIDLNDDKIEEVQSGGLKLASGSSVELDVLVLATGFDISTGSFTQIDIQGTNAQSLAKKWSERPRSYLGVSVAGFPNMLFSYGPQSPSNTCNGPVCAQVQGDWIVELLEQAKLKGTTRIEATGVAEEEYTDLVSSLLKGSLFEGTESYYFRDNIPLQGRKREPIFWMGGLPSYIEKLNTCAKAGYHGFEMSRRDCPPCCLKMHSIECHSAS